MTRKFFLCLLLFTSCSLIFSQTAERIEWLLEQNRVSYAEAARLVLEAADQIDAAATSEQAFSFATETNWLPRNVAANYAATLEGVSLLIMRAFGLKGGALYTIFKSPHYAYRELVYKNMIEGRIGPAMYVSGDLLLFVISRVLSYREIE